jgi:hypothetical protein
VVSEEAPAATPRREVTSNIFIQRYDYAQTGSGEASAERRHGA